MANNKVKRNPNRTQPTARERLERHADYLVEICDELDAEIDALDREIIALRKQRTVLLTDRKSTAQEWAATQREMTKLAKAEAKAAGK